MSMKCGDSILALMNLDLDSSINCELNKVIDLVKKTQLINKEDGKRAFKLLEALIKKLEKIESKLLQKDAIFNTYMYVHGIYINTSIQQTYTRKDIAMQSDIFQHSILIETYEALLTHNCDGKEDIEQLSRMYVNKSFFKKLVEFNKFILKKLVKDKILKVAENVLDDKEYNCLLDKCSIKVLYSTYRDSAFIDIERYDSYKKYSIPVKLINALEKEFPYFNWKYTTKSYYNTKYVNNLYVPFDGALNNDTNKK